MVNTAETVQILRVLARLRPEVWDLIDIHGPLFTSAGSRRSSLLDEVALNPQPLPPRERLQVAVQVTARAVAEAAIATQMAGRDPGEVLQDVGDDWCPTPPGPKIPWPRRWPRPWPIDEPFPIEPEDLIPAIQIEAGLVFQSYALGIADEQLSGAFSQLADRLVDTAVQGSSKGSTIG
jgi:hypothetical protein